jgi:hypothetical protein
MTAGRGGLATDVLVYELIAGAPRRGPLTREGRREGEQYLDIIADLGSRP